MPKTRKPRPKAAEILPGGFTGRKQPKRIREAILAAAGKAAYESWVEHAGFKNDARIAEWGKLEDIHRLRWGFIARAVLDAAAAYGQETTREA